MNKSSVCALAVAAASLSAANAQLFGVGNFGNAVQNQTLYTINPATGAATPVGNTGIAQISGIAWDGANLWAMTVGADLYTLSLSTGAATLVAAQANTLPEGDILFAGGTLFNVNSAGQFATVNTATAALTPNFDLSSAGSDFSGLISNGSFTVALALNGAAPDTLVAFGGGNIVATVPTGTNASGVGALASDGLTGWMSDGTSLYTLDGGTGSATLVGAFGVTGMSGLAFVPSPGAAALLALAIVPVSRRRR
jgi:hypothetical protein